jgi:Zn-dependent peptidase ImmA (M78 family)
MTPETSAPRYDAVREDELRAAAEQAAKELLATSWWEDSRKLQPLPVDPFLLARELGITVTFKRLPIDMSGKINMPRDGGPVITINENDHLNRQRFTCAHEIGHYFDRINSRELGESSFVDYRGTLAGAGVDDREIYANQFAAALLMPAHIVKEWRYQPMWQRARELGTSEQALELRLRNLRPTS